MPLNPENLTVVTSLDALSAAAEADPKQRFALTLSFDKDVKANGTKALAASPLLARVGALSINDCDLRGPTVKALLASRYLEGLTALDLGKNFFHDPGVKAIAGWAGLDRITHIGLGGTSVTGKGLAALCTSAHTGSLVHLDLSSNNLKGSAIPGLVNAPFTPRLEHLTLRYNPLGNVGVKNLGPLAGVGDTLDLWYVEMTHVGLAALLKNPALESITSLDISANPFGDAGAKILVKQGFPPQVKHLNVANSGLTDAGALLLDHPALAQLESLTLFQYTALDADTLQKLKASPHIGAAVAAGKPDPKGS